MATLQTLAGPLETERLGRTLMHEHIFNITWEVQKPYPGFNGWDPDVHVPLAREKLGELKAAGYDTIMELSVVNLGRDIPLMQAATEGTGLKVICATGLYTYDVLPRMWHFVGPGALLEVPEPLDELFRRDGAPRLTLITCGGPFLPESGSYRDNVVVVAEPAGENA